MNPLTELNNEAWLAKRLREQAGPDVFAGLTDPYSRRDAMRRAIKDLGLELVIVGSKGGKPVTWTQAFAALYREAL